MMKNGPVLRKGKKGGSARGRGHVDKRKRGAATDEESDAGDPHRGSSILVTHVNPVVYAATYTRAFPIRLHDLDVLTLTREGPPNGNNVIHVETTIAGDVMAHVGIPPDSDIGPRLIKVKRSNGQQNHMHLQNGVFFVMRADDVDDLRALDPGLGHIVTYTDLMLEIAGVPRTVVTGPQVTIIPQRMYDTITRFMFVETPLHP